MRVIKKQCLDLCSGLLTLCHVMARNIRFFQRIFFQQLTGMVVQMRQATHMHGTQPCAVRNCCIPSCIICINILSKLHRIFEFRNDIMCPNRIEISSKYKFILNYVHNIPNKLTQRVQKTNMNLPTKSAQIPMQGVQSKNSSTFSNILFFTFFMKL